MSCRCVLHSVFVERRFYDLVLDELRRHAPDVELRLWSPSVVRGTGSLGLSARRPGARHTIFVEAMALRSATSLVRVAEFYARELATALHTPIETYRGA